MRFGVVGGLFHHLNGSHVPRVSTDCRELPHELGIAAIHGRHGHRISKGLQLPARRGAIPASPRNCFPKCVQLVNRHIHRRRLPAEVRHRLRRVERDSTEASSPGQHPDQTEGFHLNRGEHLSSLFAARLHLLRKPHRRASGCFQAFLSFLSALLEPLSIQAEGYNEGVNDGCHIQSLGFAASRSLCRSTTIISIRSYRSRNASTVCNSTRLASRDEITAPMVRGTFRYSAHLRPSSSPPSS